MGFPSLLLRNIKTLVTSLATRKCTGISPSSNQSVLQCILSLSLQFDSAWPLSTWRGGIRFYRRLRPNQIPPFWYQSQAPSWLKIWDSYAPPFGTVTWELTECREMHLQRMQTNRLQTSGWSLSAPGKHTRLAIKNIRELYLLGFLWTLDRYSWLNHQVLMHSSTSSCFSPQTG